MSKISLLKRLTNRRQLILSGLALAVLSPRAVMAKEESADLRVSKVTRRGNRPLTANAS